MISVMYGEAGRTLTSAVKWEACPCHEAVNFTGAAPNCARARKRNNATASCCQPMLKDCCSGLNGSSCGGNSTATAMPAAAPDPETPFATPTLTSNSSPGATATGMFGVNTKSARISAEDSATPIDESLTATAKTFKLPLKLSGTVHVNSRSASTSTMPDQYTAGLSCFLLKGLRLRLRAASPSPPGAAAARMRLNSGRVTSRE